MEKNEPVCIADEMPFEIPEMWEWCRVGDLFTNMAGLAYKKNTLSIKADRMIRVLRGGNIGEEQVYFKGDDVFISDEFVKPELYLKKNYMLTPAVSSLDHIGKIALIDKDYSDTVVGGFVLMLIPFFSDDAISRYLLYAFAAKHHRDNCRNITHKSGQAFYNLSREQMMNLPVPIPPCSEMGRIVE
ncbi:restriction endonuclease subunit S, partial [Emergencia timonensis]|uniref:restriction endonuclease subunit S n=1 Tax=Emergencia timonensis TaxID=1776384 RepID=UPI003996BA99